MEKLYRSVFEQIYLFRNRTITGLSSRNCLITVELFAQWSSTRFFLRFLPRSISSTLGSLHFLLPHQETIMFRDATFDRTQRMLETHFSNELLVAWNYRVEGEYLALSSQMFSVVYRWENNGKALTLRTSTNWSRLRRDRSVTDLSQSPRLLAFYPPRTWRTLGKEGKERRNENIPGDAGWHWSAELHAVLFKPS